MLWWHGRNFTRRVRNGVNVTSGWGGVEIAVRVGPWQWYVARHRFPQHPQRQKWHADTWPHRWQEEH